jgi:hypothetical protein
VLTLAIMKEDEGEVTNVTAEVVSMRPFIVWRRAGLEKLAPAQELLLRLTAQIPQFVSSAMYVGSSMRKGNGAARLDMRLPPYGELASKARNFTF